MWKFAVITPRTDIFPLVFSTAQSVRRIRPGSCIFDECFNGEELTTGDGCKKSQQAAGNWPSGASFGHPEISSGWFLGTLYHLSIIIYMVISYKDPSWRTHFFPSGWFTQAASSLRPGLLDWRWHEKGILDLNYASGKRLPEEEFHVRWGPFLGLGMVVFEDR